ncbi:DMT family transporter [Polaromonas sp. P1(28)-13]|nr:DMT family transporter [Polaromonas sp. P2-4]UUZ78288.1 DMT family transporter [Polaromonas sp. P1(28)-13]
MNDRGALSAALALVINAFVWGVSWWPFRELQGHGLHPLWATTLVYLLVCIGLLAVRFDAWRGFLKHPGLWGLAVASGLTNVGFNWAVTVGDVVRVVLLFYLMPAWSVLVAWALLGEKPSTASLLRLLLAMVGVLIVLKTPASPWPLPQGGADWLAIMGGFSFAVTNALLRKHGHTPSSAHAGHVWRQRVNSPWRSAAGHVAAAGARPCPAGRRHSGGVRAHPGVHGQQCGPAVWRGAAGGQYDGDCDADGNPVRQRVIGRPGCRPVQFAHPAGG